MARKRIDITDQKFGDLKVIRLSDRRNAYGVYLWECECKCGNTHYALATSLRSGATVSCGCNRKRKLNEHLENDMIDATRYSALKRNTYKNNTSGVKGVFWDASVQKWSARISLNGKRIFLGRFDDLEDAKAARKAAESEYHKPYLEDNDNETNR